jgi:hypothetical protein
MNNANNNELVGFNSRTRKAHQTTRKCDILRPDIERRRKPHDCHGRNSAYTRRGSQYAQMCEVHGKALYPQRDTRSRQSRRPLSSKIGGSRQLHHQEQYQERQQINKASLRSWQTTIEEFTAVRLLLRFLRPTRSSPWINLPTFSIHRRLPYGKVCRRTWAHKGRCAHE